MSQTSGHGGTDPERDEWLKRFSGLPETSADDRLSTDRIAREPVARRRADAVTIEGGIDAIGELARSSKEMAEDQNAEGKRRFLGASALVLVLTPVILGVIGLVISLVTGLVQL